MCVNVRGVSVRAAKLKVAVPLAQCCFILAFQALSYHGNGTEVWRHCRHDRPAADSLREVLAGALNASFLP